MSTEHVERCNSPACKSATPGGCSDCSLAYDCQRSWTGQTLRWPLLVIALGLAVAAVLRGFGV
ncbi:MAG: hypothetical protein KDJ47_00270 [Hyphomicrobiaceae bacterium]|nr:hypothetical protein [Hyphomicrobiaceae bacterium]